MSLTAKVNKGATAVTDFSSEQNGVQGVPAYFKSGRHAKLTKQTCWVIEEAALTVDVETIGTYTLMWTPTDNALSPVGYTTEDGVLAEAGTPEALSLAAGFLLTEGIIDQLTDLRSMAVCPDNPDIVRVQLISPDRVQTRRRNVVMTSSCGICGGRDAVEQLLGELPQTTRTLTCASDSFLPLMDTLKQRQRVFGQTGGAHAAAVFSAEGELIAEAEDLGRHNALDKVIGKCLLRGLSLEGCGVLLSSRLSLEMVSKAARAGLELIAAVSAPTSLAIEVAERAGITLCGFVRGERLTAYTHPFRLQDSSTERPPVSPLRFNSPMK